jgi:hypothetical protein
LQTPSPPLLDEVFRPSPREPRAYKAFRTAQIVKQAVNDGKPLPLQVMLEAMWDLRDRAISAAERGLEAEAVAMTEKMLGAAATAAPYCHPKMAAVPVDQGLGVDEGRALSAYAMMEALRGKSSADLNRAYLDAVAGRLEPPHPPVDEDGKDPPAEGEEHG